MHDVSIRQLRAFVTVAQERSFVRAATRLNVSPSALTIAIRDLEHSVDLRLFDRSTRSVEVTPHATAFLPIAQRLLDEFTHALSDLRAVAERQKGSVVINAAATFITLVLAPAVADLARIHPGIFVRVIEDTTESVAERVLTGEADFGITTLWRAFDGLAKVLLLQDRFGVLMPSRHELATERGPLDWTVLSRYALIALGPGAGIRAQLDHNSKVAGSLPRPRYEVSNVSALADLVVRDVGLAVVPAMMARQTRTSAVVFRPLTRPLVKRDLHFVRARRRSLSPAALSLVSLLLGTLHRLDADEYICPDMTVDLDMLAGTGRTGTAAAASGPRMRRSKPRASR